LAATNASSESSACSRVTRSIALDLARARALLRIDAPDTREQALRAQHPLSLVRQFSRTRDQRRTNRARRIAESDGAIKPHPQERPLHGKASPRQPVLQAIPGSDEIEEYRTCGGAKCGFEQRRRSVLAGGDNRPI